MAKIKTKAGGKKSEVKKVIKKSTKKIEAQNVASVQKKEVTMKVIKRSGKIAAFDEAKIAQGVK